MLHNLCVMDWDVGEIRNVRTQLRPYELVAIDLRKKSNCHTAYFRCAFGEWRRSSYEKQLATILFVKGKKRYPSDISVIKMVRESWTAMAIEKKKHGKNSWII